MAPLNREDRRLPCRFDRGDHPISRVNFAYDVNPPPVVNDMSLILGRFHPIPRNVFKFALDSDLCLFDRFRPKLTWREIEKW